MIDLKVNQTGYFLESTKFTEVKEHEKKDSLYIWWEFFNSVDNFGNLFMVLPATIFMLGEG